MFCGSGTVLLEAAGWLAGSAAGTPSTLAAAVGLDVSRGATSPGRVCHYVTILI
jgi:hypothetical protein